MWGLYVLAVIGATALVAMLGWVVNKAIDFFSEIDDLKSRYKRTDDRCWDHERDLFSVHTELVHINNHISDLSTRMDAAENAIRGTKKEDSENA